ncbi:ATP-binding cassette sub-family C member 4-like [Tribolium madens]|uniref:ATP-binding cassette sub-family C member 4-like n=1 Tax=Tribolium madens TaxID=41895 RepID=UPI001CF754B5|nr:ATP-binding cassette sub-family C member 4-like [Tribolium madens]
MDQGFKPKKQTHPRETANLLSLITFFYSFALFKKGFKKELDDDDIYEVLSSCRSKQLGDQLEQQWQLDKKKNKKASMVRVLWACFGKTYMMFGVMQLIMRTIFVVAVPEALAKLISYFSPGQTELTKKDAYLYASAVIGLGIVNFVYTQNYLIALTEFAIKIRTAVCSFIYRKALKMTESSLSDITMGKIVTLITKDIFAIEMVVNFGNDIWIGLVQTAIICGLIYGKIGIAAFAGVGFFLIVLPLQIFIARMSRSFRLKTSKKTDERIQLTQETLSSIKTIKMYSWEDFFNKKISSTRKKEVNSIFKLFCLKIIIIVIGGLSAKIGFYVLVMTYVWLGNYITAEIVYFIQSCFGKLRHLLSILFPIGITFGAELSATFIRLRSILDAEEVPTSRNHLELGTKGPVVILDKVSVKIKGVEIIKSVTMEIQRGLNIVVGHVGTGKSTFLKTILEDYKIEGNLTIYGKLSYASQEPWLFPSTIKHNILFGEKLDEERYKKILEICALNYDLNSLSDGDGTFVGDNGVNLSKGQQARVNLARAVYKNADIYLLDDCLAALDGHVSDYIFKECILSFLKDKLCVLVTNNHDHIQAADWIIKITSFTATYKENKNQIKFELPKNKQVVKNDEIEKVEKVPESTNVYKEVKKSGKVDYETYFKYIRFGGGFICFSLILGMFVVVQSVVSYSDKLVSNWVTLEQNVSTYKMQNLTVSPEAEAERSSVLNLYTIIIVSATGLSVIKAMSFFAFNRNACINLHKAMISRVINAKMTFFDSHLIGNVLNRFSKDLCTIDEHLSFLMNECLDLFLHLLGIVFLVASVNTLFLIPAVIFFCIAYLARFIYLRTGRNLQRLEAASRSPLIGHLNSSLEGLTTIRAFKAQEIIKDEFDRYQDHYTSINYIIQNSMRALAFVLDSMCSIFITIVIVRFLIIPDDTSVGNVGLAISQAFHLTGLLQYGIRRWADFESQMTSVERVLQYTEVEQEKKEGQVVKEWPQEGGITYEKVSMKYGERKVLKNITLTILPKQKIGIVGRTGAGKSSIISTLFRLYDIEGIVKIDGIDIKDLSLDYLRSNIALIPQDPLLISGTIRENIDPLNKCKDEEIWKIIKIVNLQDFVTSLSDRIDNNTSLSAGQKQLLCLARAIARKNKIVVLDEATANLDSETDSLIRNVIEENFVSATVVIIAHRLVSVLAADVVMVVDDGQIVEQDKPDKLLEDKNSLFYEMIKQT